MEYRGSTLVLVDTIQRRSRTVFHHGGLLVRRGIATRESIISEFQGQGCPGKGDDIDEEACEERDW